MIELLKQTLEAFEIAAEGGGVNFHAYAEELRQAIAELESQELKQVTVKDFVHMVEGREDLIGRPVCFAQWPNGNTHPPQRTEERNFCPRCGKRAKDSTHIHTCTPPQD